MHRGSRLKPEKHLLLTLCKFYVLVQVLVKALAARCALFGR